MTGVADEVTAAPVGVVVRLVSEIDCSLDAARIREIVGGVVRTRTGHRSLAQALRDDPPLLRTGRPPAPYCIAKLLMALRDVGAQDVSLPRCGQCGRERPWVGSLRGGQWACSPCSDKPAVCAGCGETRPVVSRDRTITFGRVPLTLPAPVAALVRELVATRKGSNITTAPNAKPWLFPGWRLGQPLGDDRLGQRLQQTSLRPRQDRSTALFALATELPAAMLACMLGIHIKVPFRWQQAASGDWTAYAANISHRSREIPS